MTWTLTTAVVAILSAVSLLDTGQPQDAETAAAAPDQAAPSTLAADPARLARQEPSNATPVPPVEPAPASIYRVF